MADKEIYMGVFISHETKIDGLNFKAVIPPGGARIYTRAAAIERGARALHALDTIPTTDEQWKKEVIDNVKSLYRNRADVVLAALLGEIK